MWGATRGHSMFGVAQRVKQQQQQPLARRLHASIDAQVLT
jgi:hypothetical protein